ncbi:MAG TPA: transglycosylase domain-containing protein [Acidobacteriaceae bacterium]|nr:transglycosylase domain-containing protein [Acidobacteriaceae bacterium]
MALKVKLANRTNNAPQPHDSFGKRVLRAALLCALFGLLIFSALFGYYYYKYQGIVDERMNSPIFASTAQIYAAPYEVRTGQKLTAAAIAQELRTAGYASSGQGGNIQLGNFQLRGDTILVKPGPQSYHSTDGATINTTGGTVVSITAENGVPLSAYELEPQLITGLSTDKDRIKRRLVTYDEIPAHMVQAVLAIEDRRFFEHGGVNYYRMAEAMVTDVVMHKKVEGGSTLTMQLARGLFLSPEKAYKRKLIEIMITFQLEARFNKQQIFEMYANEINLGQRGSFAINGFGEAAQAFFGKDLKQLDLAECATLAGMIQSPNKLNPYRHPDRVMERRNLVLDGMVETGAISQLEADRAKAEPLRLAPPNVDASEAPYFVDLVHDQLMQKLGDRDINREGLRIYTSLDPDLQRMASDAMEEGMKNVDALVMAKHTHRTKYGMSVDPNVVLPQVALIALNPHTGQVLALVGGRNYGTSQLNHAVASRPTGSIFKPFVYAAAYNTSLNGMSLGGNGTFTAVTQLNDDPQNFGTADAPYSPGNFVKGEYPGMVTAAEAIAHSLNIATISLAQMVGYDAVAQLGRDSGVLTARATPSVAIGAYDATPLDMAGAYTVFANNGVHLDPWLLASVRNANGDVVSDFAPEARQVLDPRAAYLTTSLLEGVMARGTASVVRGMGFTAPAAGKTGTDHDAWFAGYTTNLICIVWVGNDDYTDIKLQGADAAAPIWAAFMKRAVTLPQYSDVHEFVPPDGIHVVRLDKTTNLLANATCPDDYDAAFLDGTAPNNYCSQMGDATDNRNVVQKLLGLGEKPDEAQPADPNAPKKKGLLQKLFGGGDKTDKTQAPPPQ